MSSPFVRGLQAGMQLGAAIRDRRRQDKLDARADEEYERQKKFQEEYKALRQSYAEGSGEFGPTPQAQAQTDAARALENASYDRVIERKAGINLPHPQPEVTAQVPVQPNQGLRTPQQIESAVGQPTTQAGLQVPAAPLERGQSLSMSQQQQRAAAGPQPMAVPDKDRLFYQRVRELGGKYLPPEKAVLWDKTMTDLEKSNFIQRRNDAIVGAMRGDRAALKEVADLYKLVPDGGDIDVSMARWDPQNQAFTGVIAIGQDGKREPIQLGRKEIETAYMMSDPAMLFQYMERQDTRARQAKQDERDDKRLGLEERRTEATINAHKAKTDLDLKELEANQEYRKALLRIQAAQEGRLAKQAKNDESARDLLYRQTLFQQSFGVGKEPKAPDPLASEEEKDAYKQLLAKRQAAMEQSSVATTLYALSTEGLDPKQRNAVQAEIEQLLRESASGGLDRTKLVKAPDGTYRYGRVVIPSSMVPPPPQPRPRGASGSF